MKYLSVCSGIEAASVAWHPLGWEPVAFSEIEKFPAALLRHRFPTVPNYGDMTKFKDWPHHAIDLLVGGTPCQSFSVAGLRKGLDDPRGNLMLTYLAIADRYRPEWVVWENVPGVLSSNKGRDFGAFLGALVQLGYGFAYRVLDAQYVRVDGLDRAVPQRRRRVFVVGYLGDWRRAAAVLFDGESMSGHPAPRREAGKGFTHGVAASLTGSGPGVERANETRGQDPVVAVCAAVAPTLNAHFGDKQGLEDQHINGGGDCSLPRVSHCLNAGGMGRIDYESETLIPTGGVFDVAHSLRGEGFDASEDGTGRGTPIVPVAVAICRDSFAGGASGRPEGAAAGHFVPVAFDCKGTEVQFTVDGAHPTLRSMGHRNSHQNAGGHAAIAFDMRGREGGAMPEGPHDTANIRAASGGSSRSYVAQSLVSNGNETLYPDGVNQGYGHASTSEANPGAILSGVREALGEEAFAEWGLGILGTFQSAEILRSALHGRDLRPAAFTRSWVVDCALSRPQDCGAGAVQSLREVGSAGCSPHGWEPSEQRSLELGAYLSGMSQPGPQAERFMHDLWQASEGLGLLREALSTVQAARRPVGGENQSAHAPWAVRRLTPEECEFLQAMPLGYTRIPYRGRPAENCPDGPRYKALGNSMAVNVMRWIGQRIQEVDGIK